MEHFETLLRTINLLGDYVYIQTHKGDIFLIDGKKNIVVPDFDLMDQHIKNQYEYLFEIIADRENYEKSISGSTFFKSIKLKEIRTMLSFKKAFLK